MLLKINKLGFLKLPFQTPLILQVKDWCIKAKHFKLKGHKLTFPMKLAIHKFSFCRVDFLFPYNWKMHSFAFLSVWLIVVFVVVRVASAISVL